MRNFIPIKQHISNTGYSIATVYRNIQNGLLPEPVKISPNKVAFPEEELNEVIELRASGGSEDDVKSLVRNQMRLRAEKLSSIKKKYLLKTIN